MRMRKLLLATLLAVGTLMLMPAAASAREQQTGTTAKLPEANEDCIKKLEDPNKKIDDCQKAPSPILPAKNEIIGRPTDRIDGPLKTTGTAPYAHDRHDIVPNQAYGYVVGSAIAKGRIGSIDLAHARAVPGVLAIVTADNAGKLDKGRLNTAKLLGGPEIQHYHQAIAVVIVGRRLRDVLKEARQAADALRRDQEQRLQTELAQLRERAAADIEAAKRQAVADLRGEVAELAIGAAEVIVQRSLDRDTQARLVDSYIEQVSSRSN